MDSSQLHSTRVRRKRALRVRKHVRGSVTRPRLCVVKTNQHIYVQLINDESSLTLVSVSTLTKELRQGEHNKKNKESARQLGFKIAALALEKEIKKVVFDRGSSKYHGVIAAVGDAAREGGLEF